MQGAEGSDRESAGVMKQVLLVLLLRRMSSASNLFAPRPLFDCDELAADRSMVSWLRCQTTTAEVVATLSLPAAAGAALALEAAVATTRSAQSALSGGSVRITVGL